MSACGAPLEILSPNAWTRWEHEEGRELTIHHQELGREAV